MSSLNNNKDSAQQTPKVLIIGAKGTIGQALVEVFERGYHVIGLSRKDTDYQEESLQVIATKLNKQHKFRYIICCIGTLHDDVVKPEKSLKQVSSGGLQHYFYINSVLPMMVIKYFVPLLDKENTSAFACLSAMVGSTQDNQLGGWYGYRASKAALNSLVKTTAIELRRSHKKATLIAIHPGTTIGHLSAPFAKNVKPEKYYAPEQSAERIKTVLESVTPLESGGFYNWNGQSLPW